MTSGQKRLFAARVLVGLVFAVRGAAKWAECAVEGVHTASGASCWLGGCLELSFGVWLAAGLLLPFAGMYLATHTLVELTFGDSARTVIEAVLLFLFGAAALVLSMNARHWTLDRLNSRRW